MAKANETYIYHITHVDNLASIIQNERLWSDRRLVDAPGERVVIGLNNIKRRRLEELPVDCHPETMVGDYVPFYFCPRSPMLYMIYRRNPELAFRDGQSRVIHLVSTVTRAIETAQERPWAFSDDNAGAFYTQFCNDLNQLPDFVNWDAVRTTRWSGRGIDPAIKSKKMAEFLVYDRFEWTGFGGIGVINDTVATEVQQILENADHKPEVGVMRNWYY